MDQKRVLANHVPSSRNDADCDFDLIQETKGFYYNLYCKYLFTGSNYLHRSNSEKYRLLGDA